MSLNLSLKTTWYSLILFVSVVPVLIMLVWVGSLYYQLLLEKHLLEEDFIGEIAIEHVSQEVARLRTLLVNKADPMAYLLLRKPDKAYIDELIYKVVKREPSIHVLLLLDKKGEIITGMESYDTHQTPIDERGGILAHWELSADNSLDEINHPLKGKIYTSQVIHHPEGAFFTLSVPVGPPDEPVAVLLARVDASILWKDLQPHLQKDNVVSYLVDSHGLLLSASSHGQYEVGDSVGALPVIKSLIKHEQWQHDQVYTGLLDQQVFGSLTQENEIGLGVVTEIKREDVMKPIIKLLIKMVLVASIVILVSLWLSVHMLRRVMNPVGSISNEFKRVGEQDYSESLIRSSFNEVQSLVDGFNHMVNEIDRNQNQLKQASVVFESTSEGILITDVEHKIVSVNRAFSEITGYSSEEVIGKNPSFLKSGHHDKEFYHDLWKTIKNTGEWRGEVRNKRKNGEVYTELLSINTFRDIQGELTYHIGVFSDISNIKETEDKLDYLAHYDQLTGLPNRLMCLIRMQHVFQSANRNSEQAAILFLDLDMFKTVNDSLGHAQGDILIQQVASTLSESLRSEDTVARLGGDEFVLILGSLKSRQDAALVAENTLALFARPFYIGKQEVFIGASCGISIYPDDGVDQNILLRNADSAMYRAKANGRNNYQFYTQTLTDQASERFTLETSLRQALTKNELRLYYQPQYSLADNQIIGVEALLRWNNPVLGMVSPVRFIPIAEETGLIVPIGEWVIKTACKQLSAWKKNGCPAIRMAVNLSARQFMRSGLEKVIGSILAEADLQAKELELELTESIIMHDGTTVVDTLAKLHEMGVGLSVDDFGTGYSSLSYIQRFPLDTLKIDRSFVRDITTNAKDAEMIDSIIALGHSMNLKVLAEGVETAEQLEYLKKKGCDEVQGFYFSKAVPADEIESLFK